MGYRHRNMYKLTGLPGWMRFGYSPGWIDRSPTGLPPAAQWLTQSGSLPKYTRWLQTQTFPPATQATVPLSATNTKEREKQMLEQQVQMMEKQLQSIRKRLEEKNNKQTLKIKTYNGMFIKAIGFSEICSTSMVSKQVIQRMGKDGIVG